MKFFRFLMEFSKRKIRLIIFLSFCYVQLDSAPPKRFFSPGRCAINGSAEELCDNMNNFFALIKTEMLLTFFVTMHLYFNVDDRLSFDFCDDLKRDSLLNNPYIQSSYILNYIHNLIVYASKNINDDYVFANILCCSIYPLHSSAMLLLFSGTDISLNDSEIELLSFLQKNIDKYFYDRKYKLFLNTSIPLNSLHVVVQKLLDINKKLLSNIVGIVKYDHNKTLQRGQGREDYLSGYPKDRFGENYFRVLNLFEINFIESSSLQFLDLVFEFKSELFDFYFDTINSRELLELEKSNYFRI